MGFNRLTNKQTLWIQLFCAKYKVKDDYPMDISRGSRSFLWRSLSKVWPLLRQSLAWSVGDGRLIKLGLDFWHCMVNRDVIPYIVGILPPNPSIGQVKLISKWSTNGEFTVKSMYNYLMWNRLNPVDNKWRLAWSFVGLQRVRQFLWLVFKERLLTNVKRFRRGMVGNHSCLLCGNSVESIIHVLRDCSKARGLWKQIIPKSISMQFFSVMLLDWIPLNLMNEFDLAYTEVEWQSLFGIICWNLLKQRNLWIFQGEDVDLRHILHSS
ncbi:hypothetical protein Goshw_020529 [Gossypium schwendimanii]|uniref:Reverse transcriptase zinc-binding domain-containing protein n=1 Tax=Gossypium schwendimanii TaxID=34291 RepID=A0A7J9MJA3_GOSSC|nr:hypothetical protein [Gossypium schwendimanii]